MTDEDLFVLFYELVDNAAAEPCCTKKTGGGELKRDCTCLHILRNSGYCACVAKFLMSLERKGKAAKDQVIADWYKYTNATNPTNKKGVTNWYFIPFDAHDAVSEDDNFDVASL